MIKIIFIFWTIFLYSQISFSGVIDTNRVWGLTIDDISGLKAIDTSLARLCKKPTTRIVFDEQVAATYYQTAINQIHNYSFIMGEILDSYYMDTYTLSQYISRVNEYLDLLGSKVDIWEIGNEVNGEWCGNTIDVIAKIDTAYSIIKAKNKKTELTLYYNKDCWSNQKNEMFYWVNKNISQRLRNGLDYVLISYYEDDCNGLQPDWQQVFDSLHVLFPNSKIGIGECGTKTSENKAAYISRYYKMNITTPNYIGGYFWWYFREDCVPYTNSLWTTFNNAIMNSSAPTVQASQVSYFGLTQSSISFNWVNGNGNKRVVFINEGISGMPVLQDGVSYVGNSTFGMGMQDGTGWYCVYNGTGSNVTVEGLAFNHFYRVMVLEYNGNAGFEGYNKNEGLKNPVNVQSSMPVQMLNFTYSVENNSLTLKWVTGQEINNLGFDIERTTVEGKDNWVKAGFIKGKGCSNYSVTYEFTDKNLFPGKYRYRIKQFDYNGNFEYYNLNEVVNISFPKKFLLEQNYPNPFNPSTNIRFYIAAKESSNMNSSVRIILYDISGREIKTLLNESLSPGVYEVKLNGEKLSSGMYFYSLISEGVKLDTKRLMMIK